MKIVSKNPLYTPVETREQLRETIAHRVKVERLNDRRLTPAARAMLKALRQSS